jgi:hypothetical protein
VTPPACTDTDPNVCGILTQTWLERCNPWDPTQLASAVGDPFSEGSPSSTIADVSTAMSETLISGDSGTCPGPVTITIMGKTVSYDLWSGLCRFAGSISLVLMVVAYMVAARVFFAGVVSTSV